MTPYLSQSIAKILLARSPLHAWYAHPQLNPNYKSEEKSEFDFGTAAHDLLLEGGTQKIVFIDPNDYPTKSNGNIPNGYMNNEIRTRRDEVYANKQTPVLIRYKPDIEAMRDEAVKAIARCADMGGRTLADGTAEKKLAWNEGELYLTGRADWISNDGTVILDYKTTTDAEPGAFNRQISRMGYEIQDAFYRRGVEATTGQRAKFIFLAQEGEPPYTCSFHGIAPSLAEIAESQVERAIRIWADCIKRNEWPGYSTMTHWAEASNWQMAEHEQRLSEEE